MADIILQLPGVSGESDKTGYEEDIDCMIVRETLEVPATSAARRVRHSDIELTRSRDRASPLLAHACSAGTIYATAKILILGTAGTPVVEYDMTSVIVSKYEHQTEDANGTAVLPHSPAGTTAAPNAVSPNPIAGAGALAAQVLDGGGQLIPRPYYTVGFAVPIDSEMERIWLNPATVTWKHYGTGGTTSRGWNIYSASALA